MCVLGGAGAHRSGRNRPATEAGEWAGGGEWRKRRGAGPVREREAAARSPPRERPLFIPPPPREMTKMPRWGHGIYILLPLLFIPAVFLLDPTAQILPHLDPTVENASSVLIGRSRVADL